MTINKNNSFDGIMNPPKYKVGDIISWMCDEDQRIHNAIVQFVNYAAIGNYLEDINYEVLDECNGPAITRFIDEYDVLNDVL